MRDKLLAAFVVGQAPPPRAPPPQPRPAPAPAPRPAPAPAPRPAGAPPPPPPMAVPPPPPMAAPPAGVQLPPQPGAPPPPPGAGLPGEIPVDENAPKPRINIESTFPKVTMLKWLGIVWLMIAAALAMMLNHLFVGGAEGEPILNLAVGLGLLGAAIVFGLIAFFNEDWRKWMSYFSTFAMVGGIAARPIVTPLVTYDFGTVIPAVLFAFAFFMYLEFLDAYQRFTDVGRMAVERNLQSFNLNQVINHFLTFGIILAAAFMGIAMLILTLVTQAFAGALGEEVQRSIEMQAVFGQALAIIVIFTIVAIVLSFLFLVLDRKTDVEQVAYSREQIGAMVMQGKGGAPTGPTGPTGPAGGVPGGPRGTAPGFVQQK